MTDTERTETQLRARWELAKNDPIAFSEFFAFTCDPSNESCPIRPFPVERPHVRWRLKIWHEIWKRTLNVKLPLGPMAKSPGIVEQKSSQNLATWSYVDAAVWDVLFHPNRLVFLQSETEYHAVGKEATGDGLLGRAKFILRHIPGRELLWPEFNPDKHFLSNTVELPNGSVLWAIAQGGHILRSHTASGLISDEAAFQQEFEDAYVAAQTRTQWFVAVSTPQAGSKFQKLVDDIPD
jgi:hypothetical protein